MTRVIRVTCMTRVTRVTLVTWVSRDYQGDSGD